MKTLASSALQLTNESRDMTTGNDKALRLAACCSGGETRTTEVLVSYFYGCSVL